MLPGNFMEQLQAMQAQVEATKKKLDDMVIEGKSPQDKIVVTVTGNRKVRSIVFNQDISGFEKEELEDYLMLALNAALEKADEIHEKEMKGAAGNLLSGL